MTSVCRVFAIVSFSSGILLAEEKSSWEITEIDGGKYVAVEQIQKFYGFTQATRKESAITLESNKIEMKLEIGSAESLLNGVKVIFSKPVAELGDKAYISGADLSGLLDPMLRPNYIAGASDFRTVILDPADGEFTLKIANLTKAQLEAKGFNVVLTGDENQDVTPEERLTLANAVHENAVFIGISFNSDPEAERGIQTSPVARGEEIIASDPFGSASVALSTSIHGSLIRRLGKNTEDGGIKRGEPEVFSAIKHPAILVKAGSLTHPYESRLIANDSYQAAIATAIVDGLGKYRFAVRSNPPVKFEDAPDPE